jgi:predicted nucleotidyltransferase
MKRAYVRREDHTSWRRELVEQFADELDASRHGVVALYLLGSTKNDDAGPDSDIDIIIHVRADHAQRRALEEVLARWDEHARETHERRTGRRSSSVGIDAHILTDEDIARRTSFAVKLESHTDRAEPVRLYQEESGP